MLLNFVLIDSIYDQNFNFKNLLKEKDCIIWKNCENLNINVKSKINKFIFYDCKNINLKISDAIIGVEFENCDDIKLSIRKNKKINSIELFKSNITINRFKQDIFLLSEKSKINYK